ncbi:RcgA family putative transporter [Roseovarius sp. MMSF_3305]|uniref:RcgA family putative transporter n=1 Tax=Roseovarius sp. MMSF_3305 TaxID=3046697 RepID=UPI0027400ECC|nr:hypothetical protein [Roseovarius sp. MMSF_3305]
MAASCSSCAYELGWRTINYEKGRKSTRRYAKEARSLLIRNGKFYVAPRQTEENFKQLFARLAAAGAGRPTDNEGFADGSWTPETLADAISAIDGNRDGVELRSVQVWFQDNENGISDPNLRWLARIFGCGDPEATSAWQTELKAAKERLASQRRQKRMSQTDGSAVSHDVLSPPALSQTANEVALGDHADTARARSRRNRKTLAVRCESLLSGATSLNLQIAYWMLFSGLGLMNYVLGTLSVTYSPQEGLDKQVGFIWAPTLTLLPLVVLPTLIFFISNLNTYWRRVGRSKCISNDAMSINSRSNAAWYARVNDFSFSFWAIVLFSFLFVFGFQWAGIYLPAYLSGDANGVQIDRYLVTLERPEVISTPQAMILSAVGYMYTASYIAIFMLGLLFSLIITLDYEDICTTSDLESAEIDRPRLRGEGQKVVWAVFRVVVFALWLALLVKLQITYLQSDSKDFVTWIRTDAAAALGASVLPNGWLKNSSISHFTTFMMMAVTVTIFIVCVMKMNGIFTRLALYDNDYPFSRDKIAITSMFLVILLLSVNLVLVGRLPGFSLMLAASAIASAYVLAGPKLRTV